MVHTDSMSWWVDFFGFCYNFILGVNFVVFFFTRLSHLLRMGRTLVTHGGVLGIRPLIAFGASNMFGTLCSRIVCNSTFQIHVNPQLIFYYQSLTSLLNKYCGRTLSADFNLLQIDRSSLLRVACGTSVGRKSHVYQTSTLTLSFFRRRSSVHVSGPLTIYI